MKNIKNLLRKPSVKVFAKKQNESSPEENPTSASSSTLDQINGPALEKFQNLDPPKSGPSVYEGSVRSITEKD
jgi:hypothetical protein